MSFSTLGADVLAALGLGGEYEDSEGWNTRLLPAAYQPSTVHGLTGVDGGPFKLTFQYEDLEKTFGRHSSVHEFSEAGNAYVQQFGKMGQRFPMRMYLWGADVDTMAAGFETLLGLSGIATLEHPMYGPKQVIPVGEIVRRDNLVTAANQVIFDATFVETTGLIYPAEQVDAQSEIANALGALLAAQAAQLAQQLDLASPLDGLGFLDSIQNTLGSVVAATNVIQDAALGFQQEFDDTLNLLSSAAGGITATGSLASETLDAVISSTQTFIGNGSNSSLPPTEVSAAYFSILSSIYTGVIDINDTQSINDFHTNEMTAGASIGSVAKNAANARFNTRNEALDSALDLMDQLNAYATWADGLYSDLDANGPGAGNVDLGYGFQALVKLVGLTAGYLVDLSFSLKQERRIVLTYPRTPIDLCAELYPGLVDDNLDFFIASNNLLGREVLEIPKGREIKYYV